MANVVYDEMYEICIDNEIPRIEWRCEERERFVRIGAKKKKETGAKVVYPGLYLNSRGEGKNSSSRQNYFVVDDISLLFKS